MESYSRVAFAPDGAATDLRVGRMRTDGPGQELRARLESRGVPVGAVKFGGSEFPGAIKGASDGCEFIETNFD